MKLFIDVETRTIIDSLTYARPTPSITLKRRDNMRVEVAFVKSGAVVELATGATGKLGIKLAGSYGAAFLAAANSWTKTGTGEDAIYSFALNLNTQEMDTAFEDEPATKDAMLEIEWTEGAIVTSSNTLPATIQNDVIRGNEAAATVANGVVQRINISGDYVLSAPAPGGDGQRIEYWITNTDTADHTLATDSAIVKPTSSSFTGATIAAGKKAKLMIEYDTNHGWELTAFINGY